MGLRIWKNYTKPLLISDRFGWLRYNHTMAINQDPLVHQLVMCANVFVRKDDKFLLLKRSPLETIAPNIVHPIGGKLDANEDPLVAAQRELLEEAGITVTNIKLKAVVLEIHPDEITPENWLIFHFTGDYSGGTLTTTEEGDFVYLSADEIPKQSLFPSVRELINDILDPHKGTVFATFEYDTNEQIIQSKKNIRYSA